jgi:molybdate transport system substrate-binding protein
MSGDLTVFAASSLTDAFGALGKALEAANPGTRITFSFGGSSALVAQLQQGAPADVFASADQPNMKKLTDAGLQAEPPVDFATNKLKIVVPKGNPKHIASLSDLARPGVIVALCAPSVPCGSFAAQALQKAGVSVSPASLEDSVRGVLSKAQLGEIDAGIVYATDVLAGGDKVQGISIPDQVNPIAVYPIAVLQSAQNPAGARAFQSFVRSPAGQAVVARYGFLAP